MIGDTIVRVSFSGLCSLGTAGTRFTFPWQKTSFVTNRYLDYMGIDGLFVGSVQVRVSAINFKLRIVPHLRGRVGSLTQIEDSNIVRY